MTYIAVARTDEIPTESTKLVQVGARAVLIVHSEGQFHAIQPRCSHADESLECGRVKRGWILCPAHGARFDLETGEPLGPPASAPIATYPVRIVGEMIEVGIA